MNEHIACLSFDFDAMTGLIARGMKSPTPISRGEFGAVAVDRILKLLDKYRVPSSWFIPGTVLELYPEHCRRIAAAGHEIGNHGYTHVPPANLAPEQEEQGLVRANEAIAQITGGPPAGYRSPSWDLSEVTIELLIKHGFVYDSSMMGHDHHPYYARIKDVVLEDEPMQFGEKTGLVEMPIAWSLDDFPHFEYLRMPSGHSMPGLQNASGVLENFVSDFEFMRRTEPWGALTYTFHPYVSGRGHRMLLIERLINALLERGARFSTLQDVALAFRDGKTPL